MGTVREVVFWIVFLAPVDIITLVKTRPKPDLNGKSLRLKIQIPLALGHNLQGSKAHANDVFQAECPLVHIGSAGGCEFVRQSKGMSSHEHVLILHPDSVMH